MPSFSQLMFYVFAAVSVLSGLGVILHRNPVRSALLLVVNFVCLAFVYLLVNAPTLAVLQILVYAGAIMVLFLFVIMLLNLGGEMARRDELSGQKWIAVLLGMAMIASLGFAIFRSTAGTANIGTAGAERLRQAEAQGISQVQVIGWDMFSRYLYPFELTSVLLLVGAIGVIHLTKRRADQEAASRVNP